MLPDRAKLGSNQMPQLFNQLCSDGFSLNLCTVLLRLCQPFTQPGSVKMLEIQPTYCLATVGDARQLTERGIHLTGDSPFMCHFLRFVLTMLCVEFEICIMFYSVSEMFVFSAMCMLPTSISEGILLFFFITRDNCSCCCCRLRCHHRYHC